MIKKIILSGLTIIWIVGFILCRGISTIGPNYWLGFIFGLVGFAAAGICILSMEKSNFSTTEIGYIPIYYSAVFVVLMAGLNLGFACIKERMFIPVFIIVDLLLMLIYGILVYAAFKNLARVKELTEYAPGKMKNSADISHELAALLSVAKDADIRQELLKFKEKVDYSNNVSQSFSTDNEERLLEALYKLREDLSDGVDAKIIIDKIKAAADIWNIRNSAL